MAPFLRIAGGCQARAGTEVAGDSRFISQHDYVFFPGIGNAKGLALQLPDIEGVYLPDPAQVLKGRVEKDSFLAAILGAEHFVFKQVEASACHDFTLSTDQCYQGEAARLAYLHMCGY